MNKITDFLYTGDFLDTQNPEFLFEEGIDAIINLSGREISSKYHFVNNWHLIDGPGNKMSKFSMIIERGLELIEKGYTILINCNMGLSRSVVIASTIYAIIKNTDIKEALEKVSPNLSIRPESSLISMSRHIVKKYRKYELQ